MKSTIPVGAIAKVLMEDECTVHSKIELCDQLCVTTAVREQWLAEYRRDNINFYDFISKVISFWVEQDGEKSLADLVENIKSINLIACSEILESLAMSNKSSEVQIISNNYYNINQTKPKEMTTFELRNVVANFIGRNEELNQMNEFFDCNDCRGVLISGLGGIGKTEFTKKFLNNVKYRDSKSAITWFAGESKSTLRAAISRCCNQMKIPVVNEQGKKLNAIEMLKEIGLKLMKEACLRWIVVLDNVDWIYEDFTNACNELLAIRAPNVFLVLTSRRRGLFPEALEFIHISELDEKDSVSFIQTSLRLPQEHVDDDSLKELSQLLQRFPLALQQAVAYIKHQMQLSPLCQNYGVANYIKELKESSAGLDVPRELMSYSQTTMGVWNMTFNSIQKMEKGKIAIELIKLLAYLNPDEIQQQFVTKLWRQTRPKQVNLWCVGKTRADDDNAEDDINLALQLLVSYSIINFQNTVITIHRLVQLSVRTALNSQASDIKFGKNNLALVFWKGFKGEDYHTSDMAQIICIWNHITKLNHPEFMKIFAKTSVQIAGRLDELYMYQETYDFAEESHKHLVQVLGKDHEDTLKLERYVIEATMEKGSYAEALENFLELLKRESSVLGVDHPETLNTAQSISNIMLRMGRWEEAKDWGERTYMSILKINGGKESKDSQLARHSIARALGEMGQKEAALVIYEEMLKWRSSNLGDAHPHTLTTRQNMAKCLYDLGRLKEAKDIHEKLLHAKIELYGDANPSTTMSKLLLGTTLIALGEKTLALNLYREALSAHEQVLGSIHPRTRQTRKMLRELQDNI